MKVNFFGPVALTKAVLPYMLKQGKGHIVVMSSMQGNHAWARTCGLQPPDRRLLKHPWAMVALSDAPLPRARYRPMSSLGLGPRTVAAGQAAFHASMGDAALSDAHLPRELTVPMPILPLQGWLRSRTARHTLRASTRCTGTLTACGQRSTTTISTSPSSRRGMHLCAWLCKDAPDSCLLLTFPIGALHLGSY